MKLIFKRNFKDVFWKNSCMLKVYFDMQYFALVGCQRLGRLTWRSLNLPMSSRACLIPRAVPRRTNKKIGQITTWRPQERNRIQSNSASRTKSRKSTSKRARHHYMSHLIRPRNTRCAEYVVYIIKWIWFSPHQLMRRNWEYPIHKLNWKHKIILFLFMLIFALKDSEDFIYNWEKKIVRFEVAPHGAARLYHIAPFYKSMRKWYLVRPFHTVHGPIKYFSIFCEIFGRIK